MQLSLFSLIADGEEPQADIFNNASSDKARKLRELAQSMQDTIDQKKNPAIGNQRVTRRRKLIAQGMIEDGIELAIIQSWLIAIAEMWEAGNISEVLRGIKSKSQVEALFRISQRKPSLEEIQEIITGNYFEEWIESLSRAGIHTPKEILSAITEIKKVVKPENIDTTKQRLKELELEIIGMKSGDFFPTPEPVCNRLIQLANLEPNWRIIEPSAGNGNVAECITKYYPEIELDLVEINSTLREILELKKFKLVGRNFLDYTTSDRYNACIMNPPFYELVEHIYHAWKLLLSDGILVSIVSESVFFNRKYQKFKDWLDDNGAYVEKVDKNAFLSSNNPTAVATRIIKLVKP
jgi:Methyltransferase small domain